MGLGGFASNISCGLVGLCCGGGAGKVRYVIPAADHLTPCPGLGEVQWLVSGNILEILPTGLVFPHFSLQSPLGGGLLNPCNLKG